MVRLFQLNEVIGEHSNRYIRDRVIHIDRVQAVEKADEFLSVRLDSGVTLRVEPTRFSRMLSKAVAQRDNLAYSEEGESDPQ